ncbi:hypothetical protein ES319_A01G246400v1 [Gossypium barbadense]|uniref:Uncharacterized protein n=1 Tax=Gossypium barbadense TaxID=3634 RepID=A0A5J5X3X4_GOSBA|nr:hypothetical protein ES319_A01G246400v1 [Gossypium barbadense]
MCGSLMFLIDVHPSMRASFLASERMRGRKSCYSWVLIYEDCPLKFIEITVEPKTRIMKVEPFEYYLIRGWRPTVI